VLLTKSYVAFGDDVPRGRIGNELAAGKRLEGEPLRKRGRGESFNVNRDPDVERPKKLNIQA